MWSLGVVLYEMVAGRVPFEGETASHVSVAVLEHEPPPLTRFVPDAPAELQRIVRKCLTKARDERYQTARDLMIDLKSLRRDLELQNELTRTAAHRTDAHRTAAPTAETVGDTSAQPVDSASHAATAPERPKRRAILFAALAAVVLAASIPFLPFRSTPTLNEKDTILLTDFVNTTGDPVFEGTLKQALAVQVGQSPFLNIFSEERVRSALRFMGRSPDERVTRDVGREVCQRQGLKAMLVGSIASLGTQLRASRWRRSMRRRATRLRASRRPPKTRSRCSGRLVTRRWSCEKKLGESPSIDREVRRAGRTGHDLVARRAQRLLAWRRTAAVRQVPRSDSVPQTRDGHRPEFCPRVCPAVIDVLQQRVA